MSHQKWAVTSVPAVLAEMPLGAVLKALLDAVK
jgi:hypothetical protein